MLTLSDAFANWERDIKPEVIACYGADDEPALSESWNNFTDSLCKNGELSDLQYHYAPAWEDAMPDDDREYIVGQLGVTMRATRKEGPREGWDADASHWLVTLRRGDKRMILAYSMGSALKGSPELCDVVHSVLLDSEAAAETFDGFCSEFGYDTDSRSAEKTWRACKRVASSLSRLFTESELDALRELFAEY